MTGSLQTWWVPGIWKPGSQLLKLLSPQLCPQAMTQEGHRGSNQSQIRAPKSKKIDAVQLQNPLWRALSNCLPGWEYMAARVSHDPNSGASTILWEQSLWYQPLK